MTDIVVTTFSKQDLEHIFDERLRVALERYGVKSPTAQPADAPPYVSKREAARLIGVCSSTIDNAARAGKIKRRYVGKSVRFEREQVLALAKPNTGHKQPK